MNEVIDLVESFCKKEEELYRDSLSETIELSDLFQKERSKLDFPFHLNIIDELGANENAHSKILAEIFRYNINNNYPFLQSFLDNIEVNENIKAPEVEVEKHRIDILIHDTDFALIIENKINYAADQPEQLKRYFDSVSKKYKEEQIFLLYLTRWGMKKPSLDSFPQEYRNILGTNYKEIDFCNNVLPWLEEKVLPECRLKEEALSSAIHQYIDHLKGILDKRENMKPLDDKLKEFLKEKLNIKEKFIKEELTSETYSVVDDKIQEIDNCKKYLEYIRNDIIVFRDDLRATFKRKLYEKLGDEWICVEYAGSEAVNIDDHVNKNLFGFRWDKGPFLKSINSNSDLYLCVEFHHYEQIYCGLFLYGESEELKDELKKRFKKKEIKLHIEPPGSDWIYLHLDKYKYSQIARDLYNDDHNKLFVEKMDDIVNSFYKKFMSVAAAWKEICSELNGEISVD